MSSTNSTATGVRFRTAHLGLIVIVAMVIAMLAALDWSLARTEESEVQNSAARAYRNGLVLVKQGKTSEAVDSLRQAHALERQNEEYELGLTEALLAAGKIGEAEPLMNEVLQDEPNDGRANLIAARLMIKKGNTRDAEAYYHRAIYGEWPSSASQHRMAARMELIELLESKGNQQDLLAELLPVEEEAGNNPQLEHQLAHLFLVAGSPSRSADLYRSLLQKNPDDASAFAGLGEADLQRGEYRSAHANFLQAMYHDPHDARIRSRFELASTLASLDPTLRELPSAEKYERSLRILQLASFDLQQCLTEKPAADSATLEQLLSASVDSIPDRVPAQVTNEMAERVLTLAQQIWQSRLKVCGDVTTAEEDPLRLIMLKLSQ